MPDNYILMFKTASEAKQAAQLSRADQELNRIMNQICAGETGSFNAHKGPFPALSTRFSYHFYRNGRKTDKFAVTSACIACGRCAVICPSGAIKMQAEKPVWELKQCIHCLACINRCPVAAIEYGRETRNKGRYVNPNVVFIDEHTV
jgi:ferredoxin